MDNDETNTQTKQSKNVASQAQEQAPVNSAPMAYPDWASTFKAYYNTGKTPVHPGSYYTSAVASSPQAHPYMWPQHMISPYGTPPPTYVPMYSHGAMYTHAAMPSGPHPYGSFGVSSGGFEEAPTGTVTATPEGEAKSSEGKSQSPQKNLKGSLGSLSVLTNKANEGEKGPATNDTFSQSGGESGGEGSSDGSNYSSPNGSHSGQKMRFEKGSMEGEDSQNCNELATYNSQNGHAQGAFGSQTTNTSSSPIVPGMPVSVPITTGLISGPVTNLNIGMDFWSGTSATSGTSLHGKRPVTSSTAVVQQNLSALGSQELSIQVVDRDERELKRQRRKQSNRESARRSRLRKQAECEELQRQVGRLRDENDTLRQEVARIREENDKLTSENIRLTEQKQKRREAEFRESNGHKGTE